MQSVKTMRWYMFAYFITTIVISYSMWTLVPDETRSYAINVCKENWSYWTNSLMWSELWNTWFNFLVGYITSMTKEYYKYTENIWNNQSFNILL